MSGIPLGEIINVDWDRADDDPTDWRYHVPKRLREQWATLGDEAKSCAAYMALRWAERELARKVITK